MDPKDMITALQQQLLAMSTAHAQTFAQWQDAERRAKALQDRIDSLTPKDQTPAP